MKNFIFQFTAFILNRFLNLCYFFIFVGFFNSCYFSDSINEIPISDFGIQGTIHYIDQEIFLFYKGGDDIKERLYFEWKLLSTPPFSSLKNEEYPFTQQKENNPKNNSFFPDVPGNYQISLIVIDEYGAKKSSGAKNITVQNRAPIPYLSVLSDVLTVGTNIYFDGSLSFDPDKEYLEYFWSISIPNCSELPLNTIHTNSLLTSSDSSEKISSSKTFFIPDCEGWYQISLKVSDRNTTSEISSLIKVDKNRAPEIISTEPDYRKSIIPLKKDTITTISIVVIDENSSYNELEFSWQTVLNGELLSDIEISPEFRVNGSIYTSGDFLEITLKIKDRFSLETEVTWHFVIF